MPRSSSPLPASRVSCATALYATSASSPSRSSRLDMTPLSARVPTGRSSRCAYAACGPSNRHARCSPTASTRNCWGPPWPRLKVVANYAVGFAAGMHPARLLACNTPGVLTETTADTAFAARPVTETRLRPGWPRRGEGQGGVVVVFGIKPSPPSAARVMASSAWSRSSACMSPVLLATWRTAAPWPRADRHSLMILIDTGALAAEGGESHDESRLSGEVVRYS